jgi:hypothetical protein
VEELNMGKVVMYDADGNVCMVESENVADFESSGLTLAPVDAAAVALEVEAAAAAAAAAAALKEKTGKGGEK